MSGKGEIRLADGFTYRGDFKKNSLEGHGVIIFPDGAEYEGQVVDGYRHGQGIHFLNFIKTVLGCKLKLYRNVNSTL